MDARGQSVKCGKVDSRESGSIAPALLAWYDVHARSLPWRMPPGANRADPYRVWLSEVMLQQTTVAAVIPYFERFTTRWADVAALAAAPEDEVMAAWAGLGYYSRARRLVECARVVAARGGFPEDEAGLRALPGLGAYTAAAVAAIAFGARAVVVDANVERVVARLFDIDTPLPAARAAIREAADAITPDARSGDFAQAMMDLGAGICSVRAPQCLICPLRAHCRGRARAEQLPVKPPKKAKAQRIGHAWWIERDGAVWLIRRAASGMLGGMRALPDDGWNARVDGSGAPPIPGDWREAGRVAHIFTHVALDLVVMVSQGDATPDGANELKEGEWWPLDRLDEAGLPTLYARAAAVAMARKG
ncbi:A/G-specific adenine glycosylase [Novosphingobium sp. KACC 22771]|uniref:A/G-specific adenine glycosylase n=1 Tax=Novosphingobium sp. KACC 22771 TaxID=3025670 RepID=UPI002366935A|nr:A/G-specific adenine glycosylase [Novosphingobium sp. KACC 22771]WDF73740.1 A/G-specific adenine glycosylase [Novosphingobium sp. KACC 22771]